MIIGRSKVNFIKEELFLLSILIPLFIGIALILTQVRSPKELFKSEDLKIKVKQKTKIKVKEEEKKIEPAQKNVQTNLLESLNTPSMIGGDLGSLTAGLVSGNGSSSNGLNISQGDVSTGQMIENTGGEKRTARVSNVVNPIYPPSAQARGINGYVILEINLSERGQVIDIVVIDSKPKGIFESAAMDAVRKWSFEPAIQEGKTIASKLKQKVNFELD